MGRRGSGSDNLTWYALGLAVGFFLVAYHFRLEEKLLGYSYSAWAMHLLYEMLMSIPRMLDLMLDTVRRA